MVDMIWPTRLGSCLFDFPAVMDYNFQVSMAAQMSLYFLPTLAFQDTVSMKQ